MFQILGHRRAILFIYPSTRPYKVTLYTVISINYQNIFLIVHLIH